MNNKILTITVPAYNVQEYLEQCLDSFIIDEILNDIEVLIVNDGSHDKTEEIALRYTELYPQTFRLISKENGGHGSTINKGIELATGKYFKIVDGDDWVDTAGFSNLVEYLKKTDSDLVTSNYTKVYSNGQSTKINLKKFDYYKEYYFDDLKLVDYISMPSINIKTDILKKNDIYIDEKMYYVDLEFSIFPIKYINTILFLDENVYMYRLGTPTQSMNFNNLIKNREQHLFVLFKLVEYYENIKTSKGKKEYIKTRLFHIIKTHYRIFIQYPLLNFGIITDLKCFDTKLKDMSDDLYKITNNDHLIRSIRKWNFFLFKPLSLYNKAKYCLSRILKKPY